MSVILTFKATILTIIYLSFFGFGSPGLGFGPWILVGALGIGLRILGLGLGVFVVLALAFVLEKNMF